MPNTRIPVLYLYIYRNILKASKFNYIDKDELRKVYRKIIYKCPASIYFHITKEFEIRDLIKSYGRDGYLVCNNKKALLEVKKLNDVIFSYN